MLTLLTMKMKVSFLIEELRSNFILLDHGARNLESFELQQV